jgi:hypothetical protein
VALPWLANPVAWFALGQFALQDGRGACRTATLASLLAAGFALLALGSWWRLVQSPAYLAWLSSMVCLAVFSRFLARHHQRTRWR